MVNPKKRTVHAQKECTSAHMEQTFFKNIKDAVAAQQRVENMKSLTRRRNQKARAFTAKYGFATKVGACLYPVPLPLALKVINVVTQREWWDTATHQQMSIADKAIRYVANQGEAKARKNKKGPIILHQRSWANLRNVVLGGELIPWID